MRQWANSLATRILSLRERLHEPVPPYARNESMMDLHELRTKVIKIINTLLYVEIKKNLRLN